MRSALGLTGDTEVLDGGSPLSLAKPPVTGRFWNRPPAPATATANPNGAGAEIPWGGRALRFAGHLQVDPSGRPSQIPSELDRRGSVKSGFLRQTSGQVRLSGAWSAAPAIPRRFPVEPG
jgi:hypothetical protein